jgi:hypothetical protein
MIKPASVEGRLDNTKECKFGMLDVKWRNLYGDAGYLTVGPYDNSTVRTKEKRGFEISVAQPTVLLMEQS